MKQVISILCSLLLLSANTLCANESVGMVTGSSTGTYIQFGKDIASVSQQSGVTLLVKSSKGSLDNIRRMSSSENAAFAIVQSDVLGYLSKNSDVNFRRYAKRLRLIYPFYDEEVHLFARKEIQTLRDLAGKTIVVGPKSSGSNMTAWNILKIAKIKPAKKLNVSIDDGISMVLRGDADAVFVVAGKPRKGFTNLFSTTNSGVKQLLQQVHFVPLNDKALLEEYVSSDLSSQEYSIIDQSIATIAVKALLVTYDFSSEHSAYFKKRCQQIRTISNAIRQNIGILRQQHHKKWLQVDLDGDMESWQIDNCSHAILQPPSSNKAKQKTIDEDIACSLSGKC
jgi:TRAP transporter TAXI family solute receptor